MKLENNVPGRARIVCAERSVRAIGTTTKRYRGHFNYRTTKSGRRCHWNSIAIQCVSVIPELASPISSSHVYIERSIKPESNLLKYNNLYNSTFQFENGIEKLLI